MVNELGTNQHGVKDYPPDTVLAEAFKNYSHANSGAGLSLVAQKGQLKHDFGLDIGYALFTHRNRCLECDYDRKTRLHPGFQQLQMVVDIKQNNVAGGWGVTQVKGWLVNKGVLIPRDALRQILHNEFDEEFNNRLVGKKKNLKHRTPPESTWSLSEQGLDIGAGIHLPTYASEDQFGVWVHGLKLMPNVRTGNVIVHYYLDLIEKRGFVISMQLMTDKVKEVTEMHKVHATLRYTESLLVLYNFQPHRNRDKAAPEFVPPQWPHSVEQSSTDNTSIEGFWHWLRDGEGHSVKMTLQQGAAMGIFLPHDAIHRQTFYWLWVPVIQNGLDEFRDYWNNHKLQKSKGKLNASRSSPYNMFNNPTDFVATARDCSIRVNPGSVYCLREAYGREEARDQAFCFVSREFVLGCPKITLPTAWAVFEQVVAELQRRIDRI
ncbi:hypothetical protein C8R45DRAFT_1046629 [Mycena sanguinolenta]|nr:hypothetical protein C8R45DRAFT_1046629 [Mycena sanguinolenta]